MTRHAISLKLQDDLFKEAEHLRLKLHKPRNSYINEAVAVYNELTRKSLLKDQLKRESALVHKNSMKILKEFEALLEE